MTAKAAAATLALAGAGVVSLSGCGKVASEIEVPNAFDLDHDVFVPSCAFASCHGGSNPAAGLDFTAGLCGAMLQRPSCLFPGKELAIPGNPEGSFLLDKIIGRNLAAKPETNCATSNQRMPIGGVVLSEAQITRVTRWIMAGASCGSGDGGAGDGTPGGGGADGGGGDGQGLIRPDGGLDGGGTHVITLEPSVLVLRPGVNTKVTATLSPPAGPAGVTVEIDTSDRDAVATPAAAFASAGASRVEFLIAGRRPTSLQTLTASADGARAEATVSVEGLYLAEVFFDGGGGPGAGTGASSAGGVVPAHSDAQWVKIVNASEVAVALSDYVLGAGRGSYGETVARLSGVLEAGTCAVVGGPSTTASNGSPDYDQVLDFSPDLPLPLLGQAGFGVGLFPAAGNTPTRAAPVDAVVIGTDNASRLVGPDGVALAPALGALDAGHTLARGADGAWFDRATPDPGNCPTLR